MRSYWNVSAEGTVYTNRMTRVKNQNAGKVSRQAEV